MREQWCRTLHMKQDLKDWGLLALRTSCGGVPGPCGGGPRCSSNGLEKLEALPLGLSCSGRWCQSPRWCFSACRSGAGRCSSASCLVGLPHAPLGAARDGSWSGGSWRARARSAWAHAVSIMLRLEPQSFSPCGPPPSRGRRDRAAVHARQRSWTRKPAAASRSLTILFTGLLICASSFALGWGLT